MSVKNFSPLMEEIAEISPIEVVGRVIGSENGVIQVNGLTHDCKIGDRVSIRARSGEAIWGEVIRLNSTHVSVLCANSNGLAWGDAVVLSRNIGFYPDASWIGRVIDAAGQPLDNRALRRGGRDYPLHSSPPAAADRRALGARLETGLRLFNTLLPMARGQRLGLFAGSGIGKSTLIGQLARNIQTDVTVIALVGERGRELREFVETSLGPEGMARSVIIAATSDQSALEKRRAAWAAMSVAEFFRDQGKQVLLVVDSITRFAEAHREIALAAGERASMRGFPPSTSQMIMSLCERAGPGTGNDGDITALFSVLVAGSDMEEPVADIIRGVLDGHLVMDRKIAERGRYPAIDVLRSVSRCLPKAANEQENRQIMETRKLLGAYDSAELMIQAGLYTKGTDELIDEAVAVWPKIEEFCTQPENGTTEDSFAALAAVLNPATEEQNQQ
ncbi:MAG: FliI/YscN family ATPase [Alphaproteobacteria bacterium]|nr:FliI/YscN family ATPase [Alphaproteobacteria bacterium]